MSETQAIERQTFADPDTGRTVIQWTRSSAKDQHLYFSSQSVTADGQYLLFISERSGAPNLHVIERADGAIRQVSHADAMLRAYCYPTGTTHGFSKATPYLDAKRNTAYWVQDDQAWRCSLERGAQPEKLADLPQGWYTGFTYLSPDGKTFCVPCTDPRAFSEEDTTQRDQLKAVPWRMIEQEMVTKLCMIDTEQCCVREVFEIPFWVTHVLFDPAGSGRLVFNCEGSARADRRFPYWGRIWRLEPDGSWQRLYAEPENETVVHENWLANGEGLVYHGKRDGEPYIAARDIEGELIFQYDTNGVPVGHAIATPDPRRVTTDSDDEYLHLYDFNAPANQRDMRLCRRDSSYKTQDEHAHPIMTPDRKGVVFTSDREGMCNVYEVVTEDL